MSKNDSKNIERLLTIVRQLVSVVKDESIPEDVANKSVGRLLVALDRQITKIDLISDTGPAKVPPSDYIKIEIEAPKKIKTKAPAIVAAPAKPAVKKPVAAKPVPKKPAVKKPATKKGK
jgi:hypothetical protein